MKRTGLLVLVGLLLLPACHDHDDHDDDVDYRFSFVASEGSSSGGATIQVEGKGLRVEPAPWIFGDVEPLAAPVPPPDADALVLARGGLPLDVEVLDAVTTPQGIAALVRDAERGPGIVLLGEPAVPLREEASRITLATREPLAVWVVLGDGLGRLATRAPR
ncbi:MAG: hypothetical protein ACYTDY_14245 [Planctomycetota bacterium]